MATQCLFSCPWSVASSSNQQAWGENKPEVTIYSDWQPAFPASCLLPRREQYSLCTVYKGIPQKRSNSSTRVTCHWKYNVQLESAARISAAVTLQSQGNGANLQFLGMWSQGVKCYRIKEDLVLLILFFFFSVCIINSNFSRTSYPLFPRNMKIVYCPQHYIWSWSLIHLETFSVRQQNPMLGFKKLKCLELWSELVSFHKVWFCAFVK